MADVPWAYDTEKWMPGDKVRRWNSMTFKQQHRCTQAPMWANRVNQLIAQGSPPWMIAMMKMNWVLARHGYITPGFGASVSDVANAIFDAHVLPEMK